MGKRYLEHSVDVTLRQVDLLSLTKFLNQVENGRRVIVVSRMSLKRAFAEGEKLNVSLTATTWERVRRPPQAQAGHRHPGAVMTPERFRMIRRMVGIGAFGLVVFVLSFMFAFPYERVKDTVVAQAAAANLDLEVGSTGPLFGFGVVMKDVVLRTRPPWERSRA